MGCTIIRTQRTYVGRQALEYSEGVSAESAGSQALCLHRLSLPPGARARAHLHENHESSVYVISGRSDFWWGPQLEHHAVVEAGDFIHIPAGVPHLPANLSNEPVEAVIARTDPNEQESVITLHDLDALPHLPPLAEAVRP